MKNREFEALKNEICGIANRLEGPYHPSEYRLVMLPMLVLRRLDCVLEPTKEDVLAVVRGTKSRRVSEDEMDRRLGRAADPNRKHPLYNTAPSTLVQLLDDPENIAPHLTDYIAGFSPTARGIFECFNFADQIERLDAANRLLVIVDAMIGIDLHPDKVDNIRMGELFEHLLIRFNQEVGHAPADNFTPRDVVRLVANLALAGEESTDKPDVLRKIYDPVCGTGGMLAEAEKIVIERNNGVKPKIFGQDRSLEAWAICCSNMLLKDDDTANFALGDTLCEGGEGGVFEGECFDYMMANPPWRFNWGRLGGGIGREHESKGFAGRFGAGLPSNHDASLLFLQHMISKMRPYEEGSGGRTGSRIAVILGGSTLISGGAGSGSSNIRRWIIENDWLDAIVALPEQVFHSTDAHAYVWLVTNSKPRERRGKVQLIDATGFFQKMEKNLGSKRNEISKKDILRIIQVYDEFRDGDIVKMKLEGAGGSRVVSRIVANHEFGFLKIVIEHPLRMNFEASPERISRLEFQRAFTNLATMENRIGGGAEDENEMGRRLQSSVRKLLAKMEERGRYNDRLSFDFDVDEAAKSDGLSMPRTLKMAIFAALGERDPKAEICRDVGGKPEPDTELREIEYIPLPHLPPSTMGFGPDTSNDLLVELFKEHIDDYVKREVLSGFPDAWVDYKKTKIGYDIAFSPLFHVRTEPRPIPQIKKAVAKLETGIVGALQDLAA